MQKVFKLYKIYNSCQTIIYKYFLIIVGVKHSLALLLSQFMTLHLTKKYKKYKKYKKSSVRNKKPRKIRIIIEIRIIPNRFKGILILN